MKEHIDLPVTGELIGEGHKYLKAVLAAETIMAAMRCPLPWHRRLRYWLARWLRRVAEWVEAVACELGMWVRGWGEEER